VVLSDEQIWNVKDYINDFLIENFDTTLERLNSNRTKVNSYIRMGIYRILYYKFDLTYVDIGKIFDRHHTTVMHGVDSYINLMKYDDFKDYFNKSNKLLNPQQLILDESKHNNRQQLTVQ